MMSHFWFSQLSCASFLNHIISNEGKRVWFDLCTTWKFVIKKATVRPFFIHRKITMGSRQRKFNLNGIIVSTINHRARDRHESVRERNLLLKYGAWIRTVYLSFSGFPVEHADLLMYNPKPESARKRQTLKLLSFYGAFNCEELTFNDLYIRKMKCSVMFCLWTRIRVEKGFRCRN